MPLVGHHLHVIVVLALRNLRRHVRRTLLTACAMILGGMLLMFSLSVGDGTHEQWIESGVRMGSGHVTIEAPEYRRTRRIEDRLPAATRATVEAALAAPGLAERVVASSPRLLVGGLASSPAGARPAQIVAVDPIAEAALNVLDDQPVEGRYLEPDDRLAAFVGQGLMESLELRLGSRLVLTAQDANGDIAAQLVRVVGVFRSGVPEIDQTLIHVPLRMAGEWLSTGADVVNVGVLAARSDDVRALVADLRRALAEPIAAGAATVLDWREAMPELDAAVTIDDLGNYIVYGILFTIIALGIVNTMLMAVMYRHREFGVLQALGLTPAQSGMVALVEGLVLTILSGVVGIGLGIGITWYFWGDGLDFSALYSGEMTFSGVLLDPVIVPLFRTARLVQVLLFLLVMGTFASLYPAYRAASIDVTEAMKFDR